MPEKLNNHQFKFMKTLSFQEIYDANIYVNKLMQ